MPSFFDSSDDKGPPQGAYWAVGLCWVGFVLLYAFPDLQVGPPCLWRTVGGMAVLVSFTLAAVALFRRKNESAVGVGGGLALLICAAPLYFVLRSPSHAFCAEGVSVVTTLTLCLTLVGGVLFLWGLVSLLEIPRRRFGGAPSAAEGKADLLKLDFYSLMWVAVAFLSVLSFVGRIVIGRCFKFGCG